MIQIRDAVEEDKDWILDLTNSCIEYMFRTDEITKEEHERWFNENIDKIKIIGDEQGAYWVINGFITVRLFEQYRNKGIGSEILKQIDGKSVIFLSNQRSIHAHYKAGFKITGVLMEK